MDILERFILKEEKYKIDIIDVGSLVSVKSTGFLYTSYCSKMIDLGFNKDEAYYGTNKFANYLNYEAEDYTKLVFKVFAIRNEFVGIQEMYGSRQLLIGLGGLKLR